MDIGLRCYIHSFSVISGPWLNLDLIARRKIQIFHWQKLVKKISVSLGIRLKILPPASAICPRMKDHNTSVNGVIRGILPDNTHNASNKLDEW